MTKREICERLMGIRDNMIHGQDGANSMGEFSCVLSATGNLIRDLILDLAAPEEEPKRETPEAEVKEAEETAPYVWIDCKAEKRTCPKCGTLSPRAAHVEGFTYYCPKCKRYFSNAVGEPKRGEGEK